MTELSPEVKTAFVKYRIERAWEAFHDGVMLYEKGSCSGAVNRLYYACYYAAVALLVNNDLSAKTHAGVKRLLGEHFVSTGKLPKNESRYFSLLFEKRHANDYEDFISISKQETEDLAEMAKSFLTTVIRLIEN